VAEARKVEAKAKAAQRRAAGLDVADDDAAAAAHVVVKKTAEEIALEKEARVRRHWKMTDAEAKMWWKIKYQEKKTLG
jgi:hypothetical protein